MPFFRLRPASDLKHDPEVDGEMMQQFEQMLYLHELIILSRLDRSDTPSKTNANRAGFRTRMRAAISQLLVCGDVLLQLMDDFSVRVHRYDHYVTFRSTAGDVIYHITKEQIDPLTLSDKQLELAGLDKDKFAEQDIERRMMDLYTRVSWQPQSQQWLIEQEVAGKVIVTSEEQISPYFSVAYELAPGAHYGRGLVETNIGDVRSINELTERMLDYAALASKQIYALDYNSQVRPQDLTLPTGSVIQARVQSGEVTDVGVLKADKIADFNVVQSVRESVRKDLAVTMLMESEAMPRGERVTATQISRVASELEGALGGVYAPIADAMQVPIVERTIHLLQRAGQLPTLPDDTVEVEAVTGINALSRESDQAKLVQVLQTIAQLGPEQMSRINPGVLLDLLMRQSGIYEPGLVKSEEDIQAERQAQMQQEQQMAASQQVMSTAGNVIENRLSQPPQMTEG